MRHQAITVDCMLNWAILLAMVDWKLVPSSLDQEWKTLGVKEKL